MAFQFAILQPKTQLFRALEKTYVINAKTKEDVAQMWIGLSQIRALLPVQMSQEEEELMRKRLWKLVNNHTFFQHPDLIRILRVHENVMAVMMNTLGNLFDFFIMQFDKFWFQM